MEQLVSKEAVIYLREDWSTVLRDNGRRFAGSKTKQLLLHASNLDTQHTTVRHLIATICIFFVLSFSCLSIFNNFTVST